MTQFENSAARQRILVVCPNSWELNVIAQSDLQARYEFIPCCEDLSDSLGPLQALGFDVVRYLNAVVERYRQSNIAGILATGDYPGCMFGAYLAEKLGLPGPSPRITVLLSLKYYSRLLQKRLVPEATPHFTVIDPPRPPPSWRPPLPFPFFLKPVKGTMSIRAQRVDDAAQLRQALHFTLRERWKSWLLFRPLSQLLKLYEPQPVSVHAFIAESALSGPQVTVDGFVQKGRVTVTGIVDSIMYPGTMSFQRFEYPSTLPDSVQTRMIDIATRLIEGSGFDHSCFNIEMFYDAATDRISIIEINPRMSYQFSDFYERVDGMSSFEVQLALSTGKPAQWTRGQGLARVAASFVMRRFQDARVISVPSEDDIAAVKARFPGTHVGVLCKPGERLSDHDQDVGSYRYGIVNMAAPSREALHARYAEAEALLPFHFAST